MKNVYLIAASFTLMFGAVSAESGYVSDGEKQERSVTIVPEGAPVYGNGLIFKVTQQGFENPYNFWVANKCSQNGTVVSARYVAIYWRNVPPTTGIAGPIVLSWTGGTADCTAYVYKSPDIDTPLAKYTYTVQH